MHWAAAHLDPMLGLRNVVCSDRWSEAWPQMVAQRHQVMAAARTQRGEQRAAQAARAVWGAEISTGPAAPVPDRSPGPERPARPPTPPSPRRPAATHPWRRYSIRPGGAAVVGSHDAKS